MKKFKIAVAAFMAVCAMTFASCSNGGDKAEATLLQGDSTAAALNIRYINISRIGQNYTLAQEIFAAQQKMERDYETEANTRAEKIKREYNTIQQKIQNNVYLSQQSAESDQRNFLNMQNQAEQWSNQRLMEIQRYAQSQMNRLNDSIRSVIRDISEANKFDFVLLDSMTFYCNPRFDITDAVIEELNHRYAPAATPAATPAAEQEKK